jgi:hypothetical protein
VAALWLLPAAALDAQDAHEVAGERVVLDHQGQRLEVVGRIRP